MNKSQLRNIISEVVKQQILEGNQGHYERVGNQTIVDSNFVNLCKGILPNSELIHLGMGDFALKTPNGTIKFERSGKLVGIGQDFVGRPHRMSDDKGGKLAEELLKMMVKKKTAILSMSESVNELDSNDPVLIKMRAAQIKKNKAAADRLEKAKSDKEKAQAAYLAAKNAPKIKALKIKRAQIEREMEQEAEPEGGKIANKYGNILNKIDNEIIKLGGNPMTESVNEALKPKKLKDLKKDEKFTFGTNTYTFIKLEPGISPNAANVKLSNGTTSVVSFGGGIVNINPKSGMGDYLKAGGRVWDNVNVSGNSVNEAKSFNPEKRRELKAGEIEIMKGRGNRQTWFYVDNEADAKQLVRLGRNLAFPTGITKNKSKIKFDKALTIEESVNEVEQLDEKAIQYNNRANYGQVVFLAGGAGSGKGFARDNFLDVANFKFRDVDEQKKQIQKLNALGKVTIDSILSKYSSKITPEDLDKIKKVFSKIKGSAKIDQLNLKNPDHVYVLHILVDAMGLKDKTLTALLAGKDNPETLPNIVFDITAKKVSSITSVLPLLKNVGYKPENIHLAWVLTDYATAIKQNKTRDRIVPDDIMLQTHEGAANTVWGLVTKALPSGMDGRVDVILGGKDNTTFWTDSKGVEHKEAIGYFISLPVKKAGGGIIPEKEWKDTLYRWIKQNAPKELTANME